MPRKQLRSLPTRKRRCRLWNRRNCWLHPLHLDQWVNTWLHTTWSHTTWLHTAWRHTTWIHTAWRHITWRQITWHHTTWRYSWSSISAIIIVAEVLGLGFIYRNICIITVGDISLIIYLNAINYYNTIQSKSWKSWISKLTCNMRNLNLHEVTLHATWRHTWPHNSQVKKPVELPEKEKAILKDWLQKASVTG